VPHGNAHLGKGLSLKRFIAKLGTWFAPLAFWRKSGAPAAEPESSAAVPAAGWFARLKQALPWRRKSAPPPQEPDQTVVVERPSREQLDAAETDVEPAPKLSWLARLKQKFRRQPKLEALEESDEESSVPSSARAQDEEAEEEAPKPARFKRLLALLSKKWVWIPSVSVVVLALMGGVAFMLLNAAQEKAKLQAELQQAQKKIAQQAAVVKQVAAAKQAAAIELSPEKAAQPAPAMIGAANPDSKPGVNAGDCLVTSKESVAASLKGCIESFNAKAGTRTAERKP